MIRKVTIRQPDGDELDLALATSINDYGLAIVKIDGMGPPPGVINTLESASTPGSRFNSKRVQQRNIVMTLAVTTRGAAEEVSKFLVYEFFPSTGELELEVANDTRTATITGYVEASPMNQFAKIENTEISIICPNPYFVDTIQADIRFSGTEPGFVFPFSNPVGARDLLFGEIVEYAVHNFLYLGEAETGVKFDISINGTVTNIYIHNETLKQTMVISSDRIAAITQDSGGMVYGDEIHIDTTWGNKSISLERGGTVYNISNALEIRTPWITVAPGYNELSFGSDAGLEYIDMRLTADILYGGM